MRFLTYIIFWSALCVIVLLVGCASVDSAKKCAGISQDLIDDRGIIVNDCPRGPKIERATLKNLLNLSPPRQKAVVRQHGLVFYRCDSGWRCFSYRCAVGSGQW